MPRPTALVHPAFGAGLGEVGWWTTEIALQEQTQTQSASGQTTRTWSTTHTVNGRLAPASQSVGEHGGTRRDDGRYIDHTHRAIVPEPLEGVDEFWRALSGGATFEVRLAAVDSARAITYLFLRQVDGEDPRP